MSNTYGITPEEIAQTLEDAADLLEQGWIQGNYRTEEGYCSEGALGTAINQDWYSFRAFITSREMKLLSLAEQALVEYVGIPVPHPDARAVVVWNDAAGRTQQEVLDAHRLAAKQVRIVAEQEGGTTK